MSAPGPAPSAVRGPFRPKWKHKASALTEFPPAIAQNRILQLSDDARLVSRELDSGKKRWKRLERALAYDGSTETDTSVSGVATATVP